MNFEGLDLLVGKEKLYSQPLLESFITNTDTKVVTHKFFYRSSLVLLNLSIPLYCYCKLSYRRLCSWWSLAVALKSL